MVLDSPKNKIHKDPLAFALDALDDIGDVDLADGQINPASAMRVLPHARRAWAVLANTVMVEAGTRAAQSLALVVRCLVMGGHPVNHEDAHNAVDAANWLLTTMSHSDNEASSTLLFEARGTAQRVLAPSGVAGTATLEKAAADLLAAAETRQQNNDPIAIARTYLEIAEVFSTYAADERGPIVERAVTFAQQAASSLTPSVDPVAFARCQLLLSGLLLNHPEMDPHEFAPAALRLADEALAVVDATATPYIVARAMLARAHALAITENSGAAQATEQAAALLDKAGLSSEAHRVRHNRSSQ